MIRLSAALLVGATLLSPSILTAQTAPEDDSAVRVGDRWVYDSKDELTGSPKDTVTWIVTQVSPTEIVTTFTVRGKPGSGQMVYDHDWNQVENLPWKFQPHNATGIHLPLAVGQTWRSEFSARNQQTGVSLKTSSRSKVSAQEMVTTEAGTFETWKIEVQMNEINGADPSKLTESEMTIWYAPQINHWVRLTIVTKVQKRVRANTSYELVDFSRNL